MTPEREAALRRRKTRNPAYAELWDEIDALRAKNKRLRAINERAHVAIVKTPGLHEEGIAKLVMADVLLINKELEARITELETKVAKHVTANVSVLARATERETRIAELEEQQANGGKASQ